MSKLKRFYTENPPCNGVFVIDGQEAVHAKTVMRLNCGDEIIVCCGDGFDYKCKICAIDKNNFTCNVVLCSPNLSDAQISVTLYQALVKADKLELIAQKVSEIGVAKLIPFESEFCVVQGQISNQKTERLNKIAIESAKQCGRSKPLKLGNCLKFDAMLHELPQYDLVIFAYENALGLKITQLEGDFSNIAVVIGSEGGFSPDEYEKLCALENVKCVTLGKRILRAETASIISCALVIENFE